LIVEWSDEAQADVRDIVEYIAQDRLSAAYEVFEAIERQVGHLAEFPRLGRRGRVRGTLELVITGTPYIAGYRIKGQAVQILGVLHGKQQWPKRFPRKA
jgi:toxin ParE1/3/4